jgi:hypothetical protein
MSIGNTTEFADISGTVDTSSTIANRDGNILERTEYIMDAITNTRPLNTEKTAITTVEQNAFLTFGITLTDINGAPIPTANINITALSAVMEKSTNGTTFSSAGITQPTFTKSVGRVFSSYQFLTAQWAVGNIYRLTLSGIKATPVATELAVPTIIWTDLVTAQSDIDTEVDTILGMVTDLHDVDIPAIKAETNNISAIKTNTDTIPATITKIDSILADTNEIQAELANGGRLDLIFDSIQSDTTAIKAKTDNLPALPAAVGSAMTLTSAYDSAKTALKTTDIVVPTADTVGNTNIVEVIGNKTDTISGTSIISLEKQIKAKTDTIPANPLSITDINVDSVDSVANTTIKDVIGNKLDSISGTSIVSLAKQIKVNADTTISSRLASASYTAPDNTSITAIKAKTDTIPSNPLGTANIAVPAQNSTNNVNTVDVIGNKADNYAGNSLYSHLYMVLQKLVSPQFVFPTLANGVTVTGGTAAWALGSFQEIIPVNTVTSPFSIGFVNVGNASANDTYEIVLYSGTAGNEIDIGHCRVTRVSNTSGTAPVTFTTTPIAANSRISCKIASSTGGNDTLTLSVFYTKY